MNTSAEQDTSEMTQTQLREVSTYQENVKIAAQRTFLKLLNLDDKALRTIFNDESDALAPLLMSLAREYNTDTAMELHKKLRSIVGDYATHLTVPPLEGEE